MSCPKFLAYVVFGYHTVSHILTSSDSDQSLTSTISLVEILTNIFVLHTLPILNTHIFHAKKKKKKTLFDSDSPKS